MDSKKEITCTTEIEKYLEELIDRSTVFLQLAENHKEEYDMWTNISMCAKARWESYRYSIDSDGISRCQGELDSLNCALYMCQLSRKTKNVDVKNKQSNPEQIVEQIRTYIQSLGLE